MTPNGRVWLLATVLWLGAVALFVTTIQHLAPVAAPYRLSWWMLAPAFAAAEIFVAHVRYKRETQTYSLSEVPLLIALCFCSPLGLVLARLVGAAVALGAYRRQTGLKLAFNLGLFALLDCCIAPLVFFSVLGDRSPLGSWGWLAAFVAVLSTDVLSDLAITLVVVLREGSVPATIVRRDLAFGLIVAFTNTSIGLVAILLLWHDPWSMLLLLGVTGVVAFAYRGYVKLARMYSRVSKLYGFTAWSSAALSSSTVSAELLERLCEATGAEYAELTLCDEDGRPTEKWVRDGGRDSATSDAAEMDFDVRALDSRGCLLLRSGEPGRDLPRGLERLDLAEVMTTALRDGETVTGVVLVGARPGQIDAFEDEDRRVFDTLANHLSIALKNVQLVARLRQEAAEREYQALHDAVTELPNRRAFLAVAAEAVAGALARGESLVIFVANLDEFGRINDTLSHALGDRAIVEVARRLSASPGATTVAHLGGDDFALIVPMADLDDPLQAGRAIRDLISRPILLGDCTAQLSASIGAVLCPDHGTQVDELLQRADLALHAAKALPQGIQLFDSSLDTSSPRRLSLVRDLSSAVDRGELACAYQPQIELGSGRICGAEVLARWTHPTLGVVPPVEFIPIAESSGAILDLTLHILRRALREVGHRLRDDPAFRLSLNVSVRCLHYSTLADELAELVEQAGALPGQLVVEITESGLMADIQKFLVAVKRLEGSGFEVSVDDFGVGYSSLAYLQLLPVREVKIDRLFMTDLLVETSSLAIVKAVSDLGRDLGIRTVAEGVEDRDTLRRLEEIGCDVAQGYLIGRPMAADAFLEWLAIHGSEPPTFA